MVGYALDDDDDADDDDNDDDEEDDDCVGVSPGADVVVGVALGVGVDVVVGDGVEEMALEEVGVGVRMGVSVVVEVEEVLDVDCTLLEDDVLGSGDEGGGGAASDDEGGGLLLLGSLPLEPLSPPLSPHSEITYLAEPPAGTVTTQETAPPAPELPPPPTSSLTPCCDGSIAQGRPLQPSPSQTISTPNDGLTSRKGVAGSR